MSSNENNPDNPGENASVGRGNQEGRGPAGRAADNAETRVRVIGGNEKHMGLTEESVSGGVRVKIFRG